jgi:hypothetical protein
MEMRIMVPDAASAASLAQRLTRTFGAERISLARERGAVDVVVDRESDPAVLRVLETVEHWLDQAAVASAEMWLGPNSYRLARWVPTGSWH